MKTFVALFALAACVAAESEPQYFPHALHPYAAAPAAPVEQPTGFYYHVQTVDKTPDYHHYPYHYYPNTHAFNAVPAVPEQPMTYAGFPGFEGAYHPGYYPDFYNNWAGHYGFDPYYANAGFPFAAPGHLGHAPFFPRIQLKKAEKKEE